MIISVLREDVLVVDHTTAEQALEHNILTVDCEENLHDTLLKDVNITEIIADIHQHASLVLLGSGKAVNDIIENSIGVLQMCEERQLFQGHLDEFHVLVIVLEDALLDVLQDLAMFVDDLVKVFGRKFADGAVLESNDRGCCSTFIDERDLTEELALAKNSSLFF